MSWDSKLYQRHLATRRFGRELEYHEVLDSTNRFLMDEHERFGLNGAVVVAAHQTAGLGRQGRTWHDVASSSLLFSVLLRYPADNLAAGFLSMIPAIALVESLLEELVTSNLILKWPNDVLLNQLKIAGVLGQNLADGKQSVSVIGVGVNINTRIYDFPEQIRNTASSILQETGRTVQAEILLARILNHWEKLFDQLLDERIGSLRESWMKYSFPIGTRLTRLENGLSITGSYQGIGDRGQLLLLDDEGNEHELFTGDIIA
jgi:BirA family biotin operon repressor/biotin-[acetyl-CoA-carboxylase] ligase